MVPGHANSPYTILSHTTERGLAFEVTLFIDRGYVPVGGVATTKDGRVLQAMLHRPATAPVARQARKDAA